MSCQQNLAQTIANAASAQGVPVDFALAIAQRESGTCHWNTDGSVRVSSAGAIGIMQLMPATAAQLGVNPYDVNDNIQGGVTYLAQLFGQLGDWSLVAMAYNWGPGRLADYLAGRRGLPSSVASYAAATAGQMFGANVNSDVADAAPGTNGIVWAAIAAAALAIALVA